MKRLLALTGTTPDAPERVIGTLVAGLTLALLAASVTVLVWAVRLLP